MNILALPVWCRMFTRLVGTRAQVFIPFSCHDQLIFYQVYS